MRKNIAIMFALSLFVMPVVVSAEDGANSGDRPKPQAVKLMERASTTRGEMVQNMKDKASTTRAEMMAKKDERVAKLREEFKQKLETRISNILEKILGKLEDVIGRLNSAKDKIANRIQVLKDRSIDTTEAEGLLSVAEEKIADAGDVINTLKDITVDPENPRDAIETIREGMQSAKDAIKAAHAALVDVINSLKPGQNMDKNNDESNDESNASTTDSE